MDRLPEIKWDLGPSPPEHTQYEVNRGKAQQHVMAKKKSINKESHQTDGDNDENQPQNQGEKE